MASTKVRGITIELGADTSGLSKALKGVNSEINKTQKDLKDVERLLKLDPHNTELLAQKQRLLSDRVGETKTKLDALKKAQDSIDLSTEDGQRQYDALTREIVSCEHELKEAQKAASGFNSATSKISSVTGKLSQGFGTLAEKTRGLSMAAAGALAGLAGLAVKAGKDADELNTLAKQTGVTTEELQKMQYAADLIDVDTDTILGGLKKLKKGLEGNTETLESMGVSVKTWNGEYRNMTDIFYDTVLALSKIPNETERDIVAMQLFGKSADELAGVIDDGGAALRTLGEEAENLGVIIPQDEIDRANDLNDRLDQLKAEILPTLMELGIQVIEAIEPYLPAIQEAIEKIVSALRDTSPQMTLLTGGILAATAALSPFFTVLSKVFGIISKVTSGTSTLGTAISGLSAPIVAIVAAIAVLVAAFVNLWKNNEEFRTKITAIWNEIQKKFEAFEAGIVRRLNDLGFNFKSIGDVIKAAWDYLCNYLAPVFENAFSAVEAVLSGALDIITGIFDVFAGLFTGNWEQMWNGVKEIFSGIWDAIVGVLKSAINIIINSINSLISGINKIGVGDISVDIPLIPQLASGGVLTSGTAIVGEAGPELVHVSDGRAMVQPLGSGDELTSLLETYLPYLAAGTKMVMDSGALVGSIAPDMNVALGTIAIRSGRR